MFEMLYIFTSTFKLFLAVIVFQFVILVVSFISPPFGSTIIRNLRNHHAIKSLDTFPNGQRVDARFITKTEFEAIFECSWPVVLTNVFDLDNEIWTEQLLERLGDKDVHFDIRRNADGEVGTFEATLRDFIGSVIDDSNHDESWYLMDEDLLQVDDHLAKQLQLPRRLFDKDLFKYFPDEIRPKSAIIIGGEGARSFLHVDPYEWTGWNYLFEGRKICKYS